MLQQVNRTMFNTGGLLLCPDGNNLIDLRVKW